MWEIYIEVFRKARVFVTDLYLPGRAQQLHYFRTKEVKVHHITHAYYIIIIWQKWITGSEFSYHNFLCWLHVCPQTDAHNVLRTYIHAWLLSSQLALELLERVTGPRTRVAGSPLPPLLTVCGRFAWRLRLLGPVHRVSGWLGQQGRTRLTATKIESASTSSTKRASMFVEVVPITL